MTIERGEPICANCGHGIMDHEAFGIHDGPDVVFLRCVVEDCTCRAFEDPAELEDA